MITQNWHHTGHNGKENKLAKTGFSNTPSILPYASDTSENQGFDQSRLFSPQPIRDYTFFDYISIWGNDLKGKNEKWVHKVVKKYLQGESLATPAVKERIERGECELYEVTVEEISGQTHKGSSIKWSEEYKGMFGAKMKVSYDEDRQVRCIQFIFAGKTLENLFARNNLILPIKFFNDLLNEDENLHLSRIDVANEFDSDLLDFRDIAIALDEGNYCGVKNKGIILSGKEIWSGQTITFGSRQSDKYIRLYDTTVKHGYLAWRCEMENKGMRAKTLELWMKNFADTINDNIIKRMGLKSINEGLVSYFKDYLYDLKSFGFVDRTLVKRNTTYKEMREKGMLLPFWDNFLNTVKVGILEYKLLRKKVSIQGTFDWVVKNVTTFLRVGLDYFGVKQFGRFLHSAIKLNEVKYGNNPSGYSQRGEDIISELSNLGISKINDCFSYGLQKQLNYVNYYSKHNKIPRGASVNLTDFLEMINVL